MVTLVRSLVGLLVLVVLVGGLVEVDHEMLRTLVVVVVHIVLLVVGTVLVLEVTVVVVRVAVWVVEGMVDCGLVEVNGLDVVLVVVVVVQCVVALVSGQIERIVRAFLLVVNLLGVVQLFVMQIVLIAVADALVLRVVHFVVVVSVVHRHGMLVIVVLLHDQREAVRQDSLVLVVNSMRS